MMKPEEFKAIIKEAMEEERKSFWVGPEPHYQDHQFIAVCRENMEEMRKNHDFVSSVRSGASVAKKTSIKTAITVWVVFIIGVVWVQIKGG